MIKNLLLLTGEDDFRLRERIRFYKSAFRNKYSEGEVESYDEDSTFRELENSVLTPNLFGDKKLVFCENFWSPEKFEQAEKTEFFQKLEDFADNCTVILVEPSLDKRKKSSKFLLEKARMEAFDFLSENEIWRWITDFTEKNGGKISHNCTKLLFKRCGENLWNLSQEIQKLIAASDTDEITEELIVTFTLPHPKIVIWEFLENLSKKNIQGAIQRFRILLQMGESAHQIFAMIIREVRIHAQLLSGIEQGMSSKEIASQAELHPFVVQKTIGLSKRFSLEKIEKMYDKLVEIDRKLKTGGIMVSMDDGMEFELQIEKFIIEHCH
ncbi:DNA polymerase III subunit delta [Candidatus Gracilibacteria bacterium]|nr:DNA polymerase III subunit delta [Candidatus Gracilibacteria bacterium]